VVTRALGLTAAGLIALTGCGASHRAAPSTTSPAAPASRSTHTDATTTASSSGPSALQAEATATAAGDIPDNQVFLVFRNRAVGYSIKYPEGWAQQGAGTHVTFRDKNNIVRIVTGTGPTPTAARIRAAIGLLAGARLRTGPAPAALSRSRAFKVVYSTESAPNPVTGKRVKLVVDRYYLWKPDRLAVVDLGTPEGVDNVDAYRLMIESFRWS
jgi:hypothetical protein